jgi:hypothetical protein
VGRFFRGFIIFVLVLVIIPLGVLGSSLIGRIRPDSVIPDDFSLYVRVPHPARLAERLSKHEVLEDILTSPGLSALAAGAGALKSSGLLENRWFRLFAQGPFEGAFYRGVEAGEKGFILAAWDARFLSPLLRFLPFLAGRVTVRGLYYVQGGKNSRFEYRMDNGEVFFLAPFRNLLLVSNNSAFFEAVLGSPAAANLKNFQSREFDLGFLLGGTALKELLESSPGAPQEISGALNVLDFPSHIEGALSFLPQKLDISLSGSLASGKDALGKIIRRDSPSPALIALLPGTAQYFSLLSTGSLEELMDAFSAFSGPSWANEWKKADSSARSLLGLGLEDILYSWTGDEFAVFGMEGYPQAVLALEIRDEKKRQEIFSRIFSSVLVNENVRLNLDGQRIPRIEVPAFLSGLLGVMGIRLPAPYYTVQNNYLFLSESAESLLAAIQGARKNEVLPKTEIWQDLSAAGTGKSSLGVFYSLDRSLPFFLKGNASISTALRFYRRGLLWISFSKGKFRLDLSAAAGAGLGISPVPGYPLDLGGKAGNRVYGPGKGAGSMIFFIRDNQPAALNPEDGSIKTLDFPGPLWIIPADGMEGEGKLWIINAQGRTALLNGNLEFTGKFPITTGLRLSSTPGAAWGKLFIPGDDAYLYQAGSDGTLSRWNTPYGAVLRAPPSFLEWQGKRFLASYPKSFLGELWLQDDQGVLLPGWPVYTSGIAFGSPLLFTVPGTRGDELHLAFISQAGELSVYNQGGTVLPAFPLELPGVFYLQPVYDGESLWLVSEEGSLFRISLDGAVQSQEILGLSVRESGYITSLDADGDGVREIFFSGEGNALYGFKKNFSSLDGFPLPVWGKPAFGDFNGDGKLECIGAGMDNKMYRWQFR